MERSRPHFLLVTFPEQSHLNPGRHLANHLSLAAGGAILTFSTSISGHRRMFPFISSPSEEVSDCGITYIPFSDGDDEGTSRSRSRNPNDYMKQLKLIGSNNLAAIIRRLAARGRPVTCVIYTLLLHWAGDVARQLGIPSAQFWIQPAAVLATYYHFFHGYQALITKHNNDPSFTLNLPGLPPLQIRDLPSFLTITDLKDPFFYFYSVFGETFEAMEGLVRPRVLVNTFEELEPEAVEFLKERLDLVAIGPVMPPGGAEDATRDMFGWDQEHDAYMRWLDAQAERSVVYVSFGSIYVPRREQVNEIGRALRWSGRPYLWVVRKIDGEEDEVVEGEEEKGMVVRWCAQLRVLSHRAVGCFVTHCGWNSALESLVCGVPVVTVPQWMDQRTNAWLMERQWGTGVRLEEGKGGFVEAEELRRCLEVVMGEGERGEKIQEKAKEWKARAWEAVVGGGSSDRNLKFFVEGLGY
ncbi:hypothetical protein HPP92_008696 [Vanilla planifolia]|uniref:Glycosyltransferase n=1 Tax=Vanilla planifolia TaxID=51239 RepID=A0A835RET6_VANPL|nr:hypothetical protein HPP92_008696 [Vanilla planifolia]